MEDTPQGGAAPQSSDDMNDLLKQLMGALKQNGGEEWEGKPQQERFAVYTVPTSSSGPSAPTNTDGAVEASAAPEDARAGLDNLMQDYVDCLQLLRDLDDLPQPAQAQAHAGAHTQTEKATASESVPLESADAASSTKE